MLIKQREPRIKWRRVGLEDEILSILVAPPKADERIESAFRRKEQELTEMFDRLDVLDSMELHRRLRLNSPDDAIATQVARLIVERRLRLMSFLANARRREALRANVEHARFSGAAD